MRNTLFAITLCLFTAVSHAAGTESGQIEPGFLIYNDGNMFFTLTGTHASTACPQIPERWAFDTTTPVGKSWLAAFLTAYSSSKDIQVEGTGTCIHGNTEGVSAMHIN